MPYEIYHAPNDGQQALDGLIYNELYTKYGQSRGPKLASIERRTQGLMTGETEEARKTLGEIAKLSTSEENRIIKVIQETVHFGKYCR